MWGAAIAGGAVHALAHGTGPGPVGMLAAGLFMLYAAGDWAQSLVAATHGFPFRGRSDPRSPVGAALLAAGLILVLTAARGIVPVRLVIAALLPAALATHLRAARPPFDRVLLGVSSFALSAPVFLFGALAAPRCLRCALAFWSLPAIGFPSLTLLISTRLPAPPATVKKLGWLAAAVTIILATTWVAAFWPSAPPNR